MFVEWMIEPLAQTILIQPFMGSEEDGWTSQLAQDSPHLHLLFWHNYRVHFHSQKSSG